MSVEMPVEVLDGVEMINETLIKNAPPITVSVLSWDIQLSSTVYLLTLAYLVLQIIVISPKVLQIFKRKKKDGKAKTSK